ncbi:MAG: hypothetical protein M0R75_06995 [Dehalococcoidia bacterium]|nr:hypothetical protein [Dehalococcoidia bacterium]
MTTEAVVNCHERGFGRNHRWDQGGVCVRCGAGRTAAVAAALEEGRVRHVGQRARQEPPERCPRCGGTVIADRDEDGDLDAYCIACGRRVNAPTAEQAEAMRRELHDADFVTVKRSNGPRRNGGRL